MAHVRDNTLREKSIAALVLVTFLVTSVVWNPAQGYGETAAFDLAGIFRSQDISQPELLDLPPEIGTVHSADWGHGPRATIHDAQNVARGPESVDPHDRMVVLIQDAHANPEAQANVKAILEFLAGQYPKMAVAVEGAAGPLHPEYFDLFREYPEASQAVVEDLKQKGELSGAELFAWEQYRATHHEPRSTNHRLRSVEEKKSWPVARGPWTNIEGVENTELYRSNLKTYRELLFKQNEIETLLSPLRAELEKRGSRVFSAELRDFLKERSRRKEGKYSPTQPAQDPNFEAYLVYLEKAVLKTLAIDLSDPFEQLRFPNLVRLSKLRAVSKDLEPAGIAREWQKFLEDLGRKLPGEKGLLAALRYFAASNGFLGAERPDGGLSFSLPPELLPRKLLEYLFYLEGRHPFGLSNYKQVLQSFKPVILRSELDAAELFEETDALEELLIKKLAVKDDEIKLIAELKAFSFFEKTLRLELTRREHEAILSDQKVFDGFIRSSQTLQSFFSRALEFYQLAGERDQVLVKNALNLGHGPRATSHDERGSEHVARISVLITGGFHTEGIEEILKKQGIRHAVITPRISRTDRGEMYRKTMTGENADLSAYFKVANPFQTKQEAVLFKQVLETAAPALFEKYQMKPSDIAENVKQAFTFSPVLSRAVMAEPLENTPALRFTPKSFGPALPQNAAIPAELMMNDAAVSESLAAVVSPMSVIAIPPKAGEAISGIVALPSVARNDNVTTVVTFDTAKALQLNIKPDHRPQTAAKPELAAARAEMRAERMKWTDEQISKILEAIQTLREVGVALNSGSIQKDRTERTENILKKIFGQRISGATLYRNAIKIFKEQGGWDGALRAAGVKPEDIRSYVVWSDEDIGKITEAIQALAQAGIDLNAKTISRDRTEQTKDILKGIFNRELSGVALYQKTAQAFEKKGGWDGALRAAGLDPTDIRARFFWSDEDIGKIPESIQALAQAGIDLNVQAISRDRTQQTKDILKGIFNRELSGVALYQKTAQAFEKKGGWDGALRAAGLDSDSIRRTFIREAIYWSDQNIEKITEAIQALAQAGIDLNVQAISRDRTQQTKDILKGIFSRELSGVALYHEAVQAYKKKGGWDGALRAAGLDPTDIRSRFFWSDEDIEKIPESIQALAQAGIDLNVRAISRDRTEQTKDILKEIFGRNMPGLALYQKAAQVFQKEGGWDGALRAARLDPNTIRSFNNWSDAEIEKIPEVIQALGQAGRNLNSGAIRKDRTKRTAAILKEIFGREVSGAALYRKVIQAYKEKGGWDGALRAAGLDPTDIRARFLWSDEDIRKISEAIQALAQAGIYLSASAIQQDQTALTTAILKEIFGREMSGAALYRKASQVFQKEDGWNGALKVAGLGELAQQFNSVNWLKGNLNESLQILFLRVLNRDIVWEQIKEGTYLFNHPDWQSEGDYLRPDVLVKKHIIDIKWGRKIRDIRRTINKYYLASQLPENHDKVDPVDVDHPIFILTLEDRSCCTETLTDHYYIIPVQKLFDPMADDIGILRFKALLGVDWNKVDPKMLAAFQRTFDLLPLIMEDKSEDAKTAERLGAILGLVTNELMTKAPQKQSKGFRQTLEQLNDLMESDIQETRRQRQVADVTVAEEPELAVARAEAREMSGKDKYLATVKLVFHKALESNIRLLGVTTRVKGAPGSDTYLQAHEMIQALKDEWLGDKAPQGGVPLPKKLRQEVAQRLDSALEQISASEADTLSGNAASASLTAAARILGEQYRGLMEGKRKQLRTRWKFLAPERLGDPYQLRTGGYSQYEMGKDKDWSVAFWSQEYHPFDMLWETFRQIDHQLDSEYGYLVETNQALARMEEVKSLIGRRSEGAEANLRANKEKILDLLNSIYGNLHSRWIADKELAQLAVQVAIDQAGQNSVSAYWTVGLAMMLLENRRQDIEAIIESLEQSKLYPRRNIVRKRNQELLKSAWDIFNAFRRDDFGAFKKLKGAFVTRPEIAADLEPELKHLGKFMEMAEKDWNELRSATPRRPNTPERVNQLRERIRVYLEDGVIVKVRAAQEIDSFMRAYRSRFKKVRLGDMGKTEAEAKRQAFAEAFSDFTGSSKYRNFLKEHGIPQGSPLELARRRRWLLKFYQAAFVAPRVTDPAIKERKDNPEFIAFTTLDDMVHINRIEGILASTIIIPPAENKEPGAIVIPKTRGYLDGLLKQGRRTVESMQREERFALVRVLAEELSISPDKILAATDTLRSPGRSTARSEMRRKQDRRPPQTTDFSPSFSLQSSVSGLQSKNRAETRESGSEAETIGADEEGLPHVAVRPFAFREQTHWPEILDFLRRMAAGLKDGLTAEDARIFLERLQRGLRTIRESRQLLGKETCLHCATAGFCGALAAFKIMKKSGIEKMPVLEEKTSGKTRHPTISNEEIEFALAGLIPLTDILARPSAQSHEIAGEFESQVLLLPGTVPGLPAGPGKNVFGAEPALSDSRRAETREKGTQGAKRDLLHVARQAWIDHQAESLKQLLGESKKKLETACQKAAADFGVEGPKALNLFSIIQEVAFEQLERYFREQTEKLVREGFEDLLSRLVRVDVVTLAREMAAAILGASFSSIQREYDKNAQAIKPVLGAIAGLKFSRPVRRIIVAEDGEGFIRMYQKGFQLLDRADLEVVYAKNGFQLIELLNQNPEQGDMVLSDIDMGVEKEEQDRIRQAAGRMVPQVENPVDLREGKKAAGYLRRKLSITVPIIFISGERVEPEELAGIGNALSVSKADFNPFNLAAIVKAATQESGATSRAEMRESADSRETAVRIETAPYQWLEMWGEAGKLYMKMPAVETSPIDLVNHPSPDKTIAARLTVYADIPAVAFEDVMKKRPVAPIPGLKKAGRIVFIPKTPKSGAARDYENWQRVVIDHDTVKTAKDLGGALKTFFASRNRLRSETRDDAAHQKQKTGVELRRQGADYALFKDGRQIGERVRFHNGLFAAAQALVALLLQVNISADVDDGNLENVIFKTHPLLANYSIPVSNFEALQELIGLVGASPSLTVGNRAALSSERLREFIRDGVPVISIPPSSRRSETREVQTYSPVMEVYEKPELALLVYPEPSGRLFGFHMPGSAELPELTRTWEELETQIPESMKRGTVHVYSYHNLFYNDWFAAFDGNTGTLLYRKGEPFTKRPYSMFTVWKDRTQKPSSEDLVFESVPGQDPGKVRVYRASDESRRDDLSEKIRFAVFGQRFIHEGRDEPLDKIALQFQDIFQLYRFPQFIRHEAGKFSYGLAFGAEEMKDWRENDPERFLSVVRAKGLITIDLAPYFGKAPFKEETPLGPDAGSLRKIETEALEPFGYQSVTGSKSPAELQEGEYVLEGNLLTLKLKLYPYPHDLIGITKSGKVVAIVFPGDKMKSLGVPVQALAERARDLYLEKTEAAAGDPITELFLLANSRDAVQRTLANGTAQYTVTSARHYTRSSGAIAITDSFHRAEAGPDASARSESRRSEMRAGAAVRSPAEVRIEGKSLPGMKTEIGRAVFMPKKTGGFQWIIPRNELPQARKEYEQWASRIGDFLNRFSKHKDIPQAVLALEGRFRSWLDLEQRIKETRTLLRQLKLAGLAEPASGEERQRILKELAGLVDFFPYIDLSSSEIEEAEFHLIAAEVPEANKRDAEILHALDLVGRSGDLPSMLKQKGAFIREHFARTKTPLEEMEQLLRTDDAVQGRALASKVLEAVSRDVILRQSPEMIKFLEGILDVRIHADAVSLFGEIKLIQKALEEVKNPREQINHPIMALVNHAETDVPPEGDSPDLVRWATRIFRDYFRDRAGLLKAENSRKNKYSGAVERADAQYRALRIAEEEISKSLKAQAASLQNRSLVVKRKQAQAEADQKRLSDELKKGHKQNRHLVRQLQAAIKECEDYIEQHKMAPKTLARVETVLMMLFEVNLDPKLADPALRQMADNGDDLYSLLYDEETKTMILNLMKRPPDPGGNDRLVEGPFDLIYNLREVLSKAISIEAGVSPEVVPQQAGTEHNRILFIRDFVVDADVEAVRQQEGGPLVGVGASVGGPGSHWIQLLMGRTPQPSVVFLNEASDVALLNEIREGDLIVFMKDSVQGKAYLILHPTKETLATAQAAQREEQQLRDAMDKLTVFEPVVPAKVTLEANDPGSFENSNAEGSGLIRTDVQSPKLRNAFEGIMRGMIDGRFDFPQWFQNWQTVDLGSLSSEEDIDRFQEALSRAMDENVLARDEELSSEMGSSYSRLIGSPFFDGREVPLRTLDLTDDSKGAALVALIRAVHGENPERRLIQNPGEAYLGFEFYRNSMAGKYYLTKQLAQMLLAYYRAREQGRTGILAPLFPMLSNPEQADFIRDEILPAAINLAVWKLASPQQLLDPSAERPALDTHLKPEALRTIYARMREIVADIPFGAMVEEMEMLKSPARRNALIRHPFLRRFNFGTSDLTSQVSGVGRDEEGSEDLLNRIYPEQLEAMSLFGAEIVKHNQETGEDKRLCVCGLKAADENFLFPVARWKTDLKIPVSTSVPLTQISAAKHALLRYENVSRHLVDRVLMNWMDTASDRQSAEDLDMRIKDFQALWLRHSKEFLRSVWKWHTRFMRAGAYASFYRPDIDPVHGVGSAGEFAYLKMLVRKFLNNPLDPAKRRRLKSLGFSKGPDMTGAEAKAFADSQVRRRSFAPQDSERFVRAHIFLNAVKNHFLKIREHDPEIKRGIQPRNLGRFLNSFVKEYPGLGLSPLPENPSPEDRQKQEDEFYRQYYLQANFVFNTMISYIHETLAELFPPRVFDEKKIDTLNSEDGMISVDLMTHRRTGWMFERPEGIVAKTVTELFVPRHQTERLNRLLQEQPDLLVDIFHRTARAEMRSEVREEERQIHLGHSLRKVMQHVIQGLPRFEELPLPVQERTNRGFQSFLKDPGHIGYAFWREHRIEWLSHYLPGYEGIRSDFFKGENRLALHMQTLRGMDFFEDLTAADRLPLRHAADVAREIKNAADRERVMVLRMAVLVDGILKSRFKNEPLTHGRILKETKRILKGRGWLPENIEQVAWLAFFQRQLAAYDLVDEKEIRNALAEVFEKHTDGGTAQLLNTPWLFDLLYLLLLAEHFGKLSPDKAEMALRQGPDSELANWEKFHRAGDKMILGKLENRPGPEIGSLIGEMERLVAEEPGEKAFRQKLPSLESQEARRALILQYEHMAGKIGGEYRSRVESELEKNQEVLIGEYKKVFGIYYADSLTSEAIGRQLVLLAYLHSLRLEGDYETVPLLFEVLPSGEGKLPVEVLMGAPKDDPGLVYLYSRVLYANGFATAAVPEIGHDEISVVSFVGTFPEGTDFDEIRGKIRQELGTIFKKKTLLQTPVKDLLLNTAARRLRNRYHVIDGLYGPLHIWKRHGLHGNETRVEVSQSPEDPAVVDARIKTASLPGILSFVTGAVGRIFRSNMPLFRYVDLSGGMASISFRAEKIDGKSWTGKELEAFSGFFKTWLDKQSALLDKDKISEGPETLAEEKEALGQPAPETEKIGDEQSEPAPETATPAPEVFSENEVEIERAVPEVPAGLLYEREYTVTGEKGIHPFSASLLVKLVLSFSDVIKSAAMEKESGSFALDNIMEILSAETSMGQHVKIVVVPREDRPDTSRRLEEFWKKLETIPEPDGTTEEGRVLLKRIARSELRDSEELAEKLKEVTARMRPEQLAQDDRAADEEFLGFLERYRDDPRIPGLNPFRALAQFKEQLEPMPLPALMEEYFGLAYDYAETEGPASGFYLNRDPVSLKQDAANWAGELKRNPLIAVKTFAQLFAEQPDVREDDEYKDTVVEEGEKVLLLMELNRRMEDPETARSIQELFRELSISPPADEFVGKNAEPDIPARAEARETGRDAKALRKVILEAQEAMVRPYQKGQRNTGADVLTTRIRDLRSSQPRRSSNFVHYNDLLSVLTRMNGEVSEMGYLNGEDINDAIKWSGSLVSNYKFKGQFLKTLEQIRRDLSRWQVAKQKQKAALDALGENKYARLNENPSWPEVRNYLKETGPLWRIDLAEVASVYREDKPGFYRVVRDSISPQIGEWLETPIAGEKLDQAKKALETLRKWHQFQIEKADDGLGRPLRKELFRLWEQLDLMIKAVEQLPPQGELGLVDTARSEMRTGKNEFRHVLFADDDKRIRTMMQLVLQRLGFPKVSVANDGAQALEMFRSDPSIDVIASDMLMPNMNGRELYEAAKKIRKVPFIVISGDLGNDEKDISVINAAQDTGELLVLSKPIEMDKLQSAFEKLSNLTNQPAVDRSELRLMEFQGATVELKETLLKVGARGGFDIVDHWVPIDLREPVAFAAETAGNYSEEGITVYTGDREKARLWIASRLTEMLAAKAKERGISDPELERAIRGIVTAMPVSVKLPSSSIEQGPVVPVDLSFLNMQDWQELFRSFPVVLANLVSLNARLLVSVDGSRVDMQEIETQLREAATKGGLKLGEKQLQVFDSGVGKFFGSLAKVSEADALLAGSEEAFEDIAYHGKIGTRWIVDDDAKTNMPRLAAEISTVLYAALDQKLRANRFQFYRPSQYSSGALLQAVLTAVQAYLQIRAAA